MRSIAATGSGRSPTGHLALTFSVDLLLSSMLNDSTSLLGHDKNKSGIPIGMPLENEPWLGDLEREVQAATDHSEVVMRSVDDVPAEVTHDTDVTSESVLNATTELAHHPVLRFKF